MKLINRILFREVSRNTDLLSGVIALILVIVSLDAIAPWPFQVLIDNVLSANPVSGKFSWLLDLFSTRELLGFFVVFVYFFSTFLLTIVQYVSSILTKRFVKKITSDFSKKAFNNLQSLIIGFYSKQQIGDYIYRLSYDVSALGELFELGFFPLITSGLYLVATAVIMFLIDVRLTLISFTAMPFLVIGLYAFNRNITKATNRSEHYNSAAFSFVQEALTHLKIIQAFSQEHRESISFNEKIDTSLLNDIILYRLGFLLSLLVGIIIAISYSVIISYGILSVFYGGLTTGLLVVFIFYLDNLVNPILNIIYAAVAAKEAYVKIGRMEDFFSKKSQINYRGPIVKIVDTKIHFDRVSLLGNQDYHILTNVSFDIEPNKKTVIFGVNGSGKTSVVSLIMRFIDKPNHGTIFLGGININDYDIKVLRDNIAFVPQEITLFNDTIRNNIAFGHPKSSLLEVRQAAKLAAADEFIKKMPGGYNFKVGEAGMFVSGGQRQRLMLARALLKKEAKILLFDETLSALDVKTRQEVIGNIYDFAYQKTIIIVSNIFSVVHAADNAIVLNKGKVIYSGKGSRLSREMSLYRMIIEND